MKKSEIEKSVEGSINGSAAASVKKSEMDEEQSRRDEEENMSQIGSVADKINDDASNAESIQMEGGSASDSDSNE